MTTAEKELVKFFKNCECLEKMVFHNQTVIGELNKKVNAKISFYGGIEADNRHSLLVEIINKETGKIDAQVFHFSSIIGKFKMPSGDMRNYHLYRGMSNDFEWYCAEPTNDQRKKIMALVYAYLNLYK